MTLISLKNRYPFRVAAPSFIYPADYATNVRRLADYLDEIELLFFESDPKSLPSRPTVRELVRLGVDRGIGYNVHLPIDLALDDIASAVAQKAVDRLCMAMERAAPLDAVTHTLHLDYREKNRLPDTIKAWQSRMLEVLGRFMAAGPFDPGRISIETLDYPPRYFDPLVTALGFAVCLDIGHMVRYGHDLEAALQTYGDRTTILHLHGVAEGCDHLSARRLGSSTQKIICRYLEGFRGSLSLEVFSLEKLDDALRWLADSLPQPN